MFAGDIHKRMPLAHIHRADDFARQAGLAGNGVHEVNRCHTLLGADAKPQPRLADGRGPAGFGFVRRGGGGFRLMNNLEAGLASGAGVLTEAKNLLVRKGFFRGRVPGRRVL